ncbi:hypothetical protein TEA_016374 [Camellia sinensis var. sinensis]|uniref:Dihydroflavonol 4-reductase n=1 Tax=Camellia sinensis var. sinensis TaxID=542762 RepID=A0A4S4D527_CAMSN|nr:hypothetical protein TEA_016374 [Camellia sinensis var. sinensis]
MEGNDEGIVCVTGGTGFVASWLIMKLLEHDYTVRTTIRSSNPDSKKDLSYLTNLPGASEKLQIFNADLALLESFDEAIQGCIGVFHVAYPIDFEDKEPEEVETQRAINATLGILKACLKSNTVKRVVYTSSSSTIILNGKGLDVLDERHWSDIDFVRSLNCYGASYMISKTLTEKAALEFAGKHGLDLVTTYLCLNFTRTIAVYRNKEDKYKYLARIQTVHIDDVANAHIFLLEHPDAEGSALKEIECFTPPHLSSKKLLDTGFKFKYSLEEMYDETIRCCKEKGFL